VSPLSNIHASELTMPTMTAAMMPCRERVAETIA